MRRSLMAAATIGLAVALASTAGAGQTERVKTKVTIKDGCFVVGSDEEAFECRMAARGRRNYDARFKGRVKSDEPKCERNRKVTVILVEQDLPGRGDETGPIGTARSDENGRWVFTDDKPGFGDYIAKAAKKQKGDLICKRDKSPRTAHESPF
jgi:hypothetical protein